MTHTRWKTHRTEQLLGETEAPDPHLLDARLAGDLGQLVHDRRSQLALSHTDLAARAGLAPPDIARIEGGDTVPTLPLLHHLARALDGTLRLTVTADDARLTFTPSAP